jgi:hypothetical protein
MAREGEGGSSTSEWDAADEGITGERGLGGNHGAHRVKERGRGSLRLETDISIYEWEQTNKEGP